MPRRRQSRKAGKAWDTRKIDEAMMAYQINSLEIPNGDAESMAAGLMNMVGRICDAIMPRKKATAQTTRLLVECLPKPTTV